MDGLALFAVCAECRQVLGAKIDKIQQPERDALLFHLRGQGKSFKLLISAHAENGRIQLTEKNYQNPPEAPSFCMLLRRRLTGGRIAAMEQRELDRVLTLRIEGRSELGDPVEYRLVTELMGKHSNVILVMPDGTVGDSIRHVGPQMSSVRLVLPGVPYREAPMQEKKNPLQATAEELRDVLRGADPAKSLASQYQGLSRRTAEFLCGDSPEAERTAAVLETVAAGRLEPGLVCGQSGEPVTVLPFPAGSGVQFEPCGTLSEAYDRFYEKRDAAARIQRHSTSLRNALENRIGRAANRLGAFRQEIEEAERYEVYRTYGDCIFAELYRLKKGTSSFTAVDYGAEPPQEITVPLDRALSPQENGQRYYKLYRKHKAAKAYAEEQLEPAERELDYLEEQLDNIGKCETLTELEEIREELIREGYVKREGKPNKQQRAESEPMVFRSPDGVPIRVGKNGRQNDALTLRANGECTWLHAKNTPGSHVIIDTEGEPPEATLYAAGQLAAWFSRGRNSANLPVDYTPRKYVKKPSGARSGMVIYTTNRTMYVTPDGGYIATLERIK